MKPIFTQQAQQKTSLFTALASPILPLLILTLTLLSCSPEPTPNSTPPAGTPVDSQTTAQSNTRKSSVTSLTWDKKHLQLDFHPSMGELILTYPFTVTSNKAVSIKSVTPDCDCLVVPLSQKTFQPGEKGQLELKFLAGTRTGKQERSIEVHLVGQENPIKLTASIQVPEIISSKSKSLSWKVGEESQSKKIVLNLSEPLKLTSYQSSSKHFEIELIETTTNKTWTVNITPKDTNKTRSSIIMLRTNYPHRPWDRLILNARIDP